MLSMCNALGSVLIQTRGRLGEGILGSVLTQKRGGLGEGIRFGVSMVEVLVALAELGELLCQASLSPLQVSACHPAKPRFPALQASAWGVSCSHRVWNEVQHPGVKEL